MTTQDQKLKEVYRQRVLQHSREPHNFGHLDNANREALGFNPLCGDKLTVRMTVAEGRVTGISFEGTGCAISIASASMMTDAVLGQPVEEADKMIDEIQGMFDNGSQLNNIRLNELAALEGVRTYPSRIKCATLAWTTLDAALKQISTPVSSE